MAELVVAEAFLSTLFEKLLKWLTSREFAKHFHGKKSINDQLKVFNGKLKTASLLLDDAEDRQASEPSVKEWLEELKDVILKADDLMDNIINQVRSKQESDESGSRMHSLIESIFPSSTEFDKSVQVETVKIMDDLNILLERAVVLCLEHGGAQKAKSCLELPAPLREECHVYGRDFDREKVLELLLSDNVYGNRIGVLPIVGLPGLGKTTLAQLVYTDRQIKEHGFELKAWVTVSAKFDIFRVMKTILQQVDPQSISDNEDTMELQRRLKEALRGKKFLFVLDDVWNEDYDNWDFLMNIFTPGDSGSRIIVTTRSQYVGSILKTGPIYEPKLVSTLDCWQIFVDHAFNRDLDTNLHLQDIGKRIVKKCKGLPLAIKYVGGLLRYERNPEKWESILRSPVWKWSKNGNGVLPSIWLSYSYLPSSLKQCFAYCSIFPKGYAFTKEELILLWMAEGLLQSDHKEKRMEEIGEEYFDDLISRSFFQRTSQGEMKFVMHDLVNDLAMCVSGEFCFRYENDSKINLKQITSRTRHLYYNIQVHNDLWRSLSKAKHLRTFMSLDPCLHTNSESVEKLILDGRFLRVLSLLGKSSISVLPDSFSNLKHLRYLNLSYSDIKEIHCSICTLSNLQTLLLSYCKRLSQLPKDMGKLINLRHLDTTGSPLKEMPPGMGKLKELQTLTDFVLSKHSDCSAIEELGQLHHLGGKLQISGLQNVDLIDDALKANLMDKACLSELALEWKGDTMDTIREKHVLAALQPNANLKKLSIVSYAASSFPNWVCDSMFSKLVSVHLQGNHEFCCYLPPLGQLPSLRELMIYHFHGVNKVGAEFYGDNSSITPFQSLEILKFSDMQILKEWSCTGQDGKEVGCFPRLKELTVYGCPNLVGSLSFCETIESVKISYSSGFNLLVDHLPRLKRLWLEGCKNLNSLTLEEETGTVLNSLSSLYLYDCRNLVSLPEHLPRLVPSLTHMGLISCPDIEFFPKGSLPSSLNQLEIEKCSKLVAQYRHWDLQQLSSLTSLTISSCDTKLDSFPEGLLPSSLTYFKLQCLPNLKSLNGRAFQQVALHALHLSGCGKLQYLPEEVLTNSLQSLKIIDCPLLEERYRVGEGYDWRKISHILDICFNPSSSCTIC